MSWRSREPLHRSPRSPVTTNSRPSKHIRMDAKRPGSMKVRAARFSRNIVGTNLCRMSCSPKVAQVRQQALRLQGFDFPSIKPCVVALRTQIHHHLLIAFAAHLFHRHVARRACKRFELMRFVRNVMPLEKHVVVLHFELFEILGADEGAFARFANVHLFENRMRRETPANERRFTTRTLHGHSGTVSLEKLRVSRFSCGHFTFLEGANVAPRRVCPSSTSVQDIIILAAAEEAGEPQNPERRRLDPERYPTSRIENRPSATRNRPPKVAETS